MRFQAANPALAGAPREARSRCPKRKTRPGGQPDGSSHMGAGVDGRSRRIQPRWGGTTTPTCIGRKRGAARSNPCELFLGFRAGISARNLLLCGAAAAHMTTVLRANDKRRGLGLNHRETDRLVLQPAYRIGNFIVRHRLVAELQPKHAVR